MTTHPPTLVDLAALAVDPAFPADEFLDLATDAAPRLLAELRALAERWECEQRPPSKQMNYSDHFEYGGNVARDICARSLRALLGEKA